MGQLIGYSEAANLTGLTVGTLYSKVCRREIPHIRLSARLVRFEVATLQDWLKAHRVEVREPKSTKSKKSA